MALARELQFGPFTARDVRVAVLPAMMPDTALLGMNVLSRLQLLQRGGRMMLQLEDRTRAGATGG
jgi:predicted aspartyl protease